MSGNSTGDRVTSDDDEPVPSAGGLWLGEVTGLRLGDAPREEREDNYTLSTPEVFKKK